jgi:nucleotide-binding universal stress UspA family protein
MRLERVVVGVDGSDNSLAADEPIPVEQHRDEIEARFRGAWTAPLTGIGATVERELRYGPPVPVILGVARERTVDLIVVGSRGVGGHPELLLGSTSSQISQLAECPVVIIPPLSRRRP